MKYDERELLIIWLDSFGEIEYIRKRALYELLVGKTDLKKNLEHNRREIVAAVGEDGYNALINSANQNYLKETLASLEASGAAAITLQSENYPELLKEIDDPPLALYCKGDRELFKSEIFGVVGSRKSLPLSLAAARDFSEELVNGGFTLCTGTAEGVDSEVIKTALKKNAIISVSAGGIYNIYPAANSALAEDVAKRGLLISERREDIKPMPYMFPIRNRIIAGLSVGTLVVSGGLKSGTMYTAEYCLDYGRDLFAVPYSIGIASGAGCNELIKRSAYLADSPDDILSLYGKAVKKEEPPLSDIEREIIAAISEGAAHIEKIAAITEKQVYEITSALTVLEIKGLIYKTGINTYGLTRNREI